MKRILMVLLFVGPVMAHVPVIVPSDTPQGDIPPKLEERPLPPVVFENAITHTPIIILPYEWH